ncbi:hypothetical protein D3C80_1245280 [compost metagenome]
MGDFPQLGAALRHQAFGMLEPQLGGIIQGAFAVFLFEQIVKIFGAEFGSLGQ